MTLLKAFNLTYRLGRTDLVKACSAELRAGAVTAILGPNGAGKSTLLRLLGGDLVPSAGAVEFAGRPLARWSASDLARRRALVGQFNHIPFPYSCEEVVGMGRLPFRYVESDRERRQAVRRAMISMRVWDMKGRIYSSLSGGEQQRVSIARALAQLTQAHSSDVECCLLLDEPTASLDLAHQFHLMTLLREQAAAGSAVAVVLHDINLALRESTDVIVLQRGEVVAAGQTRATLTPALLSAVFGVRVEEGRTGHGAVMTFGEQN